MNLYCLASDVQHKFKLLALKVKKFVLNSRTNFIFNINYTFITQPMNMHKPDMFTAYTTYTWVALFKLLILSRDIKRVNSPVHVNIRKCNQDPF